MSLNFIRARGVAFGVSDVVESINVVSFMVGTIHQSEKVVNSFVFLAPPILRIDVMNKFSRNRLLLLVELQGLVQKSLESTEDSRTNRRLRLMRKAMKEWIAEAKNKQNEPVVNA